MKAVNVISSGKANVTLLVEENCKICDGTGYYLENDFDYFCSTCSGLVGMKNKNNCCLLTKFIKAKAKVTIHRVGHAGYAGGERGRSVKVSSLLAFVHKSKITKNEQIVRFLLI